MTEKSSMEQARIFSQKFETFYRCLLGLFLVLTILTWIGLVPADIVSTKFIQFLMAIVLLDGVHVIFTVVTLLGLPEFRQWSKTQLQSSRTFVIIPIICTILVSGYLKLGEMTFPVMIFTGALTFILARMHTLAQIKGLSLLYNKVSKERLEPSERVHHEKVERVERFLFNAFIGAVMLDRILVHVVHLSFSTKIPFLYVSLALGLLILANAFRYPRVGNSNKRFYLTNCLIVSISVYFPFVNLMQKSLHGFEYVFLSVDMTRRSKANKSRIWFAKAAVIIGLHLLILLYALHFISQKRWLPANLVTPLLIAHYFFDFFHYYVDSLIFRFSDPSVRSNLAPLILPPAETYSCEKVSEISKNQAA